MGDILVINSLFILIYYWYGKYTDTIISGKKDEVLLLLNACYFFCLYFVPIKLSERVLFIEEVIRRSSLFVLVHCFLFISCLNIFSVDLDSSFTIIYYIVFFFMLNCWRVIARIALKKYRISGHNYQRIIIVGVGKVGLELYDEMKTQEYYGYKVMGLFDDNESLKESLPDYIGTVKNVEEFCLKNKVDEIYCALPGSQDEKIVGMLNFSEKNMIRFFIVPEFYRYLKKKLVLSNIDQFPVIAVRDEPLQHWHNRFIKRLFDILFSLFVLIVIYPPVYLLLAVLIKRSSPGPVIFKQERTGLYAKKFNCLKFRSMTVNIEADEKQAEKGDPRTTKIGEFMRKTNIDELPQFYNVLKGEMSVVGPRPHMIKHTEIYSELIDKYMVRHLVKPGITGWAQVTGYRGETKIIKDMEERIKRDVWYIENYSPLLDVKIIFRTIIKMFSGDNNAY